MVSHHAARRAIRRAATAASATAATAAAAAAASHKQRQPISTYTGTAQQQLHKTLITQRLPRRLPSAQRGKDGGGKNDAMCYLDSECLGKKTDEWLE